MTDLFDHWKCMSVQLVVASAKYWKNLEKSNTSSGSSASGITVVSFIGRQHVASLTEFHNLAEIWGVIVLVCDRARGCERLPRENSLEICFGIRGVGRGGIMGRYHFELGVPQL
jgi:hypothetical protein